MGSLQSMALQGAVTFLASYTAQEIKDFADGFKNPDGTESVLSGSLRALLHGLSSCAAAGIIGGNCGSAASGGVLASGLGSLLSLKTDSMTEEQKQNYINFITSLSAFVIGSSGGDTFDAGLAARIEVENNSALSGAAKLGRITWKVGKVVVKNRGRISKGEFLAILKSELIEITDDINILIDGDLSFDDAKAIIDLFVGSDFNNPQARAEKAREIKTKLAKERIEKLIAADCQKIGSCGTLITPNNGPIGPNLHVTPAVLEQIRLLITAADPQKIEDLIEIFPDHSQQLRDMAKIPGFSVTDPDWREYIFYARNPNLMNPRDVENSAADYYRGLGGKVTEQVSYIDGKIVRYGEFGSTRPDLIVDGVSVEVKSYDLSTPEGVQRLIKNVTEQAIKRDRELPDGMPQHLLIDTYGQEVSDDTLDNIRAEIERKTKGIIKAKDIKRFDPKNKTVR